MNLINELPLVLVSGQARSGTTILTKAIAAHPQVLSNGKENNWLRDLAGFAQETFGNESRVKQLAVSQSQFLDNFRGAAYQSLFPELAEYSAENTNPLENIKALSTFSSLREDTFDMVPQLLPNVFLVNIVRNGIEVVSSRMSHQHIGKGRDFRTHCIAWAHGLHVVKWAESNDAIADRFFLVRHHDLLVAETCRDVFGKLQQRLGLDDSDACHDFVQQNFVSRNKGSASPQSAEGNRERQLAWQQWDQQQRDQFEEVCGAAMEHLGYPIPWGD